MFYCCCRYWVSHCVYVVMISMVNFMFVSFYIQVLIPLSGGLGWQHLVFFCLVHLGEWLTETA